MRTARYWLKIFNLIVNFSVGLMFEVYKNKGTIKRKHERDAIYTAWSYTMGVMGVPAKRYVK